MKKYSPYVFALSAVFSFGSCSSPQSKPEQQQKESVQPVEVADNGKKIFEEKCVACHGADGTSGIAGAADLRVSRSDTISILRMITHGKNSMPAFVDQLGAGEIDQVTHYVFSLRK